MATRRMAASHARAPTERRDVLRRLIQQLPRRQEEVIVLRHLEGMSYQETAAVLGIAPATARAHAYAGRETLRHLLLTKHPDWFDERSLHQDKRK